DRIVCRFPDLTEARHRPRVGEVGPMLVGQQFRLGGLAAIAGRELIDATQLLGQYSPLCLALERTIGTERTGQLLNLIVAQYRTAGRRWLCSLSEFGRTQLMLGSIAWAFHAIVALDASGHRLDSRAGVEQFA